MCIVIAALTQDTMDKNIVSLIGLSSFVFWGLSVLLGVKNFANILSAEMDEMSEKMQNDEDFFSMVDIKENPSSLRERFIQSGFKQHSGYLHKRQFSWTRDYLNYYAFIVEDKTIVEYVDDYLQRIDEIVLNKSRFHQNNIIYIIFFSHNITQEELDFTKDAIINQEVAQELPCRLDVVFPVIYDVSNERYIIKLPKKKYSWNLLTIAERKILELISRGK